VSFLEIFEPGLKHLREEKDRQSSCERREIARRRVEEERAEAFFSSASDDEVGGLRARLREQLTT
jgi:hypothetical protein